MTTEELIKKLKENKRVDVAVIMAIDGVKRLVILNDMSRSLFRIPTTATNWLDLEVVDSQLIADSLGTKSRKYVSAQISEYLDTPLDKRESVKKYRLKAIRHYTGPVVETGYVKEVVCKRDYSGFKYSPVPFEFTEQELKTMKYNEPVLAPAIDAMKEEVKDDED